MKSPQTIFEKIWNNHVVYQKKGYPAVLYIDTHLIHEVTSPQAFAGLKKRNIPLLRRGKTWATTDHNVPTKNQELPIKEILSRQQVDVLHLVLGQLKLNKFLQRRPFCKINQKQ